MIKKGLRNIVLAGTLAFLTSCVSSGPNNAMLTINSEPPEARVYVKGNYMGKTPLSLNYILEERHYDYGGLKTYTITVGKEGFLPKEKQIRLKILPKWKNLRGRTFNFSDLFLLQGDPRYLYNFNQNENTNKGSAMDELNKALDFYQRSLWLNKKNR